MTRSIHHLARQLETEHGMTSYTQARRIVQAYADRVMNRPDLWDGDQFTALGAQHFTEDVTDVLAQMALSCQTATVADACAVGEVQ